MRVSFGAQFVSGLIMPSMMFIGNINYVLVAVIGGLRVAHGQLSLGDVQAFIQYSRFTQPLTTVASMANLHAVRGRVRRARLRAARRRRGADRRRTSPRPSTAAGHRLRARVLPVRRGPAAHHRPVARGPSRPTVAIVGPTGPAETPGQPGHALLRRRRGPDHADGVDVMRHACARPGPDRHGAPGHLAVRRDDPRQHRLRAVRTPRRAGARRGQRATFVDQFVHSLPDGYDTPSTRRARTCPPASASWSPSPARS